MIFSQAMPAKIIIEKEKKRINYYPEDALMRGRKRMTYSCLKSFIIPKNSDRNALFIGVFR